MHPLIGADEAALDFDFCRLQTNIGGTGRPADGHQHLLRVLHHLFAIGGGEGHLYSVVGLFHFVDLGAGVGVDTPLAEDAGQFLAHVLIFVGDQARQVFNDGDLATEALEDGAELHPHRPGTDDYHRLGNLGQDKYFHVGQDAVGVRLHPRQHAGVGAGSDHDILSLDSFLLAAGCFDRDGMDSVVCRAGKAAVALDGGDFVLAHEEVEALDMLGDDPVFAVEDGLPVDGDRAHAFHAVLSSMLQVVIEFGVKQQGLGGNTAPVQAGAAQLFFPLDEGDLQPILPGADGGGVAPRTAANDNHVVNCLCHK